MSDTDTIRRNDIDARVEAMKDIRRQAIADCIKVVREEEKSWEREFQDARDGSRTSRSAAARASACKDVRLRLEALKDAKT